MGDARRAVEEAAVWTMMIEVTRLIAKTKSIHQDLGIYMNRNSTINYMIHILRAICGRCRVEGGRSSRQVSTPWGAQR